MGDPFSLSLKVIAARMRLGTSKSANARLHQWMAKPTNPENTNAN
jgi:hypothetical protein